MKVTEKLMKNILYNRAHLLEYLKYGILAALAFSIPVLVFFLYSDYNQLGIIYLGSIFFMFVIMAYSVKLSSRRPEYRSTWMMIAASHMAVLTGILFSVLMSVVLCFFFVPGFLSGNSDEVLADAPSGLNNQNWGLISFLLICATVLNFGAGGFMGVLGPYVFKKNQMKDKTAILDPDTDGNTTKVKSLR